MPQHQKTFATRLRSEDALQPEEEEKTFLSFIVRHPVQPWLKPEVFTSNLDPQNQPKIIWTKLNVMYTEFQPKSHSFMDISA